MPGDHPGARLFERLLVREAGTKTDAPAVAAAARRLSEHFSGQLIPLIGELGVTAIYARSLHLAQQQCPSLAPVLASQQDDGPIARAQRLIEHQESAVALDLAVAMLTSAVELLASFIGEGLATSLLRKARPDDFAGSTPEDITR
jgi:hypothetical protein